MNTRWEAVCSAAGLVLIAKHAALDKHAYVEEQAQEITTGRLTIMKRTPAITAEILTTMIMTQMGTAQAATTIVHMMEKQQALAHIVERT